MENTTGTITDTTTPETNAGSTAAAAEAVVDSIRKLVAAVGSDPELKQKLEDTLAALTGEQPEADEEGKESDNETAAETPGKDDGAEPSSSAEESEEKEEKEEEDSDGEDSFDSDPDLADVFNEDAIAGMVVGFVAGAAVVGGGVLLHKLLADR